MYTRLVGQRLVDGFGDAEVDHLGDRHVVVVGDQDVRRLDVPVDDAFLMGVLDRLADLDEQLQPLAGGVSARVAVFGDRRPFDQFHDEVRPPGFGAAAVQHRGDALVVHQGQGLPLGLEAGDDLPGVHARLDDLQGDFAFDRLLLHGHVDHAHAAVADLVDQLVAADLHAGLFGDGGGVEGGGDVFGRNPQEARALLCAIGEAIRLAARSFGLPAHSYQRNRRLFARSSISNGDHEDCFVRPFRSPWVISNVESVLYTYASFNGGSCHENWTTTKQRKMKGRYLALSDTLVCVRVPVAARLGHKPIDDWPCWTKYPEVSSLFRMVKPAEDTAA